MKNEKHTTFPGQIAGTKYLPECLNSLPNICNLIDEYLVDSIHPQILQNACEHGASNDHLEFILKRTAPNWKLVVNSAARGGYIHIFEWMYARQDGRCPWASDFEDVYKEAAAHGHLDVIKWLHGRGIGKIGDDVIKAAARKGHLPVLQWLSENALLHKVYGVIDEAVQNGHLEVVQWLYIELCVDSNPCADAIKYSAMRSDTKGGQLEVLQWLHQQGACESRVRSLGYSSIEEAFAGGYFDVVKWLYAKCKRHCARYSGRYSPNTGNLPMLQFLNQHYRYRFQSDVIDQAAKSGHLAVLKWLHEQRIEDWTTNAMDYSAMNGHLDVVRWLHENRAEGCTKNAMKWAGEKGHVHVVKWLHDNRSEGCGDLSMQGPVKDGHLEVVKWLVEHKPEMCRDNMMEVAAREGHLDIACYLDENTTQCSSEWGLGAAAKEGLVKVILLLIQRDSTNGSFLSIEKMGDYAEKLFSQLSKEGAATASPLWNDVMEMLERFDGVYALTLLSRALKHGNMVIARQFLERRSEHEKSEYLARAAACDEIVLMRWLLAIGTPLSVKTVTTFKHVEAAWWLSEPDRVKLVCYAQKNGYFKMLLWVLNNTRFEDYNSKHTIRCALKDARNCPETWLAYWLSNDARRWCYPSKQDEVGAGAQSMGSGRRLKRARQE